MPWLETPTASLRYELQGQGPQTLILCHEMGGSLESWDGVCARLGQEFRILRWDQRGSGLSEKVVGLYALDTHAEDLEHLIAALELRPPFYLSGVAAGVAVALTFAGRQAQDRIGGAVFCAPALGVAQDRRQYLFDRAALAASSGMRAVSDMSLQLSYPEAYRSEAATYRDYRARFLSNDPVSYGLANRALADFVLGDRLQDITYPVTFLAGTSDRLRPPSYVEPLSRKIAHSTFMLVDSGHVMQVQAPDAVARVIRDLCSGQAL